MVQDAALSRRRSRVRPPYALLKGNRFPFFVIIRKVEMMARFEKHIFICSNKRDSSDSRGSCTDRGSAPIIDHFKKRIKELGLNKSIRVNTAGCLDACKFGPAIVVYPEQVWYGRVTDEDVEEIIQSHLIGGIPVERLMIREKPFDAGNG